MHHVCATLLIENNEATIRNHCGCAEVIRNEYAFKVTTGAAGVGRVARSRTLMGEKKNNVNAEVHNAIVMILGDIMIVATRVLRTPQCDVVKHIN